MNAQPLFKKLFGTIVLAALVWSPQAQAGLISIGTVPLSVTQAANIQPNLMFVLDDSGSMAWDFMSDFVISDGSDSPYECRSYDTTKAASSAVGYGMACCVSSGSSINGQANIGQNTCWSGSAPFGTNRAMPPFMNPYFNGMAYNPAVTYLPPVNAAGTSMPSMTAANTTNWTVVPNDYYGTQNTSNINLVTQFPDTEWCTNAAYTNCMRNGNYELPGMVGNMPYTTFHATTATGTGTRADGPPNTPVPTNNVAWGPHYYNIIPSEYCDSASLRNCQIGSSGAFTHPAYVRWCNSLANAQAASPATNTCEAIRTDTFQYARYPTVYPSTSTGYSAYTATAASATGYIAMSCSGSNKEGFSAMTVGGTTIAASVTSNKTLATLLSTLQNNMTGGYSATYQASGSGYNLTITAPLSAGNLTSTITFAFSGSGCTVTTPTLKFAGYSTGSAGSAGTPAAYFQRIDIVPSITQYAHASTRSDCANAGYCTYAEEMTNFANWWAYYHTRMQMMKSSASLTFGSLSANFRVGYYTIDNNQGNAFMNPTTFSGTGKTSWFSLLTKAIPSNGTPLLSALTTIGRYYGGQYTAGGLHTTINNVSTVDPVQYACQRNFMLLATDGFWNAGNPYQLDGKTLVGNQDSATTVPRPMYDGSATPNTLADDAYYYNTTDLRTGTTGSAACLSQDPSVTNSDVCGNGTQYSLQNMVSFTMGLGASGYMQFIPGYQVPGTTPDYDAVANGTTASSTVCTWQTSGACNWPAPVSNTLSTIDDLWHAAVNGGGTYYSATDPATLIAGLGSALNAITAIVGDSAAAATSNPNVVAGSNSAFVSNFTSAQWTGELSAYTIDLTSGGLVTPALWTAAAQLDSTAYTSRAIYMFDTSPSSTTHRKAFAYASMTTTEQSYFSSSYITGSTSFGTLSQFCAYGVFCVPTATQAASYGTALVNFIAGDRSNEGALSSPTLPFRQRTHLLGDIVDSEAAYVQTPLENFSDPGYATYQAAQVGRQGMVYVGANDGMLHAFNASTGAEVWAYVPYALLPKLYVLADKGYANLHQFYVDSTPVVRDVYDGSAWHTVLICGLGAGGRSYFALDVTNPTNPLPLWEFTDTNLGYTLGKPEIGKLSNGAWVALLPSGYNNVSPGDGNGHLYVLNAMTGAPASGFTSAGLVTGTVGTTATPSSLSNVRAWVDNIGADNTMLRAYGGDNLGNLWRFDINGNIGETSPAAYQLATLVSSSGAIQPITARPELGQVSTYAMVFVGTGRYLGTPDLSDATSQSVYGIKDKLDKTTYYNNPRLSQYSFVQQTLVTSNCPSGSTLCTSGATIRTIPNPQPVNLAINNGWYVDLPATAERDNTDPLLVQGTLVVNTNVLNTTNICSMGGSSWQNYFDYSSGAAPATANNIASVQLSTGIASRPVAYKIGNNLYTTSSSPGCPPTGQCKTPPPATVNSAATRRVEWRELPQR
ncbi:MAG: PQQ-binding-like beta-propeller repeat protein [Paucibacter sp.]|nr:PQQ-binding-like beta-propeller repeat protein [Roseateles sp.]